MARKEWMWPSSVEAESLGLVGGGVRNRGC